MRIVVGLLVLVVGCKDNKKQADAPVTHDDAPAVDAAIDSRPAIDAPPLIACTPTAGSTVKTRLIGRIPGPNEALLATSPPNDGRMFVISKMGQIYIFENEQVKPTPFLDISEDAGGKVLVGGQEMGLLGLAFHPQYATNRKFYVFYTADNPLNPVPMNTNPYLDVVVEYTTSATDPNVADPASARTILEIGDFATNHNGGMIEFGSDGMLYIGTGDGGSGGDPARNGQNKNALLGKMLRLDVDNPANGKPYGIPTDNPYADGTAGKPEIWMIGLRNPWRWSFDRANGDMWIGDVGQGQTEEVDVVKAGQQSGANLGWSIYEGSTCCIDVSDKCTQAAANQQACDPVGKVNPLDERRHADNWRAIIGGQVYRGTCFPDLVGWYFYDDVTKHILVKARLKADNTLEIVDLPPPAGSAAWPELPTSIHADARGELFMTTDRGDVMQIEAGP